MRDFMMFLGGFFTFACLIVSVRMFVERLEDKDNYSEIERWHKISSQWESDK